MEICLGAYRPRRPESTALYEVVRDNLETLYGAIEDGALAVRIPKHARKELEAYLDCGLLCRGFARLRCEECGQSRLVAFSCKGRGFCPSCTGRRMNATSANLIERVLPPQTSLRQWVLTNESDGRSHRTSQTSLPVRRHASGHFGFARPYTWLSWHRPSDSQRAPPAQRRMEPQCRFCRVGPTDSLESTHGHRSVSRSLTEMRVLWATVTRPGSVNSVIDTGWSGLATIS